MSFNPRQWRNRIIRHEDVDPAQLLANPNNFRRHPKEQIQAMEALLEAVGFVDAVHAQDGTDMLVDGHLRVEIAMRWGIDAIPVEYLDLNDYEAATVLATFDKISSMAVIDDERYQDLMETLPDNEITHEMLTAIELTWGAGGRVKLADDLDNKAVPDPPKNPITNYGDTWYLGDHILICGDCTEKSFQKKMQEKNLNRVTEKLDRGKIDSGAGSVADMMWTDPPYGVNYTGKTNNALKIQNDGKDGVEALLIDSFTLAQEMCRPGAPFYIARPAGELSVTFGRVVLAMGWKFHEELQWVKSAMVLGHSDYHIKHETIIYGYMPGEGRRGRGSSYWYGDDSQVSTFEVAKPAASKLHPTSKPIALIEPMVRNSSAAGGIIYDPFGGSGSTLLTCEITNRRCWTFEIDPGYADVIVQRYEELTGESATRDAD